MQISASGGLSSADFSTWRAKMDQAAFKGLDNDANGSISAAEFQAAMQKLPAGPPGPATPAAPGATSSQTAADVIGSAFKAIDGNGDGEISQSELSSALAAHGHRHHRKPAGADSDAAVTAGQASAPGSIQSGLASTFAAQLLGQGQSVAGLAADASGAVSSQASATTGSTAARNAGGFDLLGFLQEQFLGGDTTTAAAKPGATNGVADPASGLGAAEQARQMLLRYAFTQTGNQTAGGMRMLA